MFIYFRLIVYFCMTCTLMFCSINFCDWTCFQYRVYFVFNYWFHGRKSILSRGEIQHKQRGMIQWQTHVEGTMWFDFVVQTDFYFHLLFIDLKIYNIYKNVWTSVLRVWMYAQTDIFCVSNVMCMVVTWMRHVYIYTSEHLTRYCWNYIFGAGIVLLSLDRIWAHSIGALQHQWLSLMPSP
jgi:hypothetical protein